MSLVYRSEAHLRSGELEKAAAAAERAAQMSFELCSSGADASPR